MFIDISIKCLPILYALLDVLDFRVEFVVFSLVVWDLWQVLGVLLKVGDALELVDATFVDDLWVNTILVEVLGMAVDEHVLVGAFIDATFGKALCFAGFFCLVQVVNLPLKLLDLTLKAKYLFILFRQYYCIPLWRLIQFSVLDLHLWDTFLFLVDLWLKELNLSQIRLNQGSVRGVILW